MFLARLPDGAKYPRVYRLTPDEITPGALANFFTGTHFGTRKRPCRAWRYDSQALIRGVLRSKGIAAIDSSPEEACMRIRVFQIHEKYGDAA